MASEPVRHHYIPQFQLRWWCGTDGRLERYTKPVPGKIMVKRVPPTEVGFAKNLYTSFGEIEAHQNWLERRLFQIVDSRAAPVLVKLNQDRVPPLTAEEMSAWSIFIRSLYHRTPDMMVKFKDSGHVEWLKAIESARDKYQALKGENDPPTFDEYRALHTPLQVERLVLRVMPSVLFSERVGTFLNSLHKRYFDTPAGLPSYLISDAILMMSNGLQRADGLYALPLSPRRLLVAAYEKRTLDAITDMKPRELVSQMNAWTVGRARYFVGSVDRSQCRFIHNRFGKIEP